MADIYQKRVKEMEARGLSDAEICAELDRMVNLGNLVMFVLGAS